MTAARAQRLAGTPERCLGSHPLQDCLEPFSIRRGRQCTTAVGECHHVARCWARQTGSDRRSSPENGSRQPPDGNRRRPASRPLAVLSRMTEVLFVEVLRSWIKSLGPGEGGWLGAIADRHIGKALQLIHEQPEHPWTLGALGRHAGLGRSAFAARFTRLVGQPVHRYLVARRMDEAALMLESGDDAISRIATRVGYETATAFSKAFKQHYSFSPGRYRERGGTGPLGSPHQHVSAST